MTINTLLEKARERSAQRERLGPKYHALSKLSLRLLIEECKGQSNAAEIIRCFYGVKTQQGTISKALNGDGELTRHSLRLALDFLTPKEYALGVDRQVANHLGGTPVYHDILKHGDEYVIYAGCMMVRGSCHVIAIDQRGVAQTLALKSVEVA